MKLKIKEVGDSCIFLLSGLFKEAYRSALALMLDHIPLYVADAKQNMAAVRAKRILGIVIAQLVILVLTPRPLWEETDKYPAVRERFCKVLDAAVDTVPEWFWTLVTSMLTAFARELKILAPPMAFPPTDRDLAYTLCDALRSA